MTIHYIVGSEEWTHSFQARFLSFDEIAQELMQAGFSNVYWADQAQGWVAANRPQLAESCLIRAG